MACLVSRSTTSTIERMEVPIRSEPEELNLTIFQDWKVRWNDYAAATRVKEETPNLGARHAIIRSALAKEWSLLWQAGCLEINDHSDDIDTIVSKLESYVRRKRNPVLDRKLFHSRKQQEGESVDQYFSALITIE